MRPDNVEEHFKKLNNQLIVQSNEKDEGFHNSKALQEVQVAIDERALKVFDAGQLFDEKTEHRLFFW
jgi:hypothetical protein